MEINERRRLLDESIMLTEISPALIRKESRTLVFYYRLMKSIANILIIKI